MSAEALWALGEVLACLDKFNYCKGEEDRQKVQVDVNKATKKAKELLDGLDLKSLYLLHGRLALFTSLEGPMRHVKELVRKELVRKEE